MCLFLTNKYCKVMVNRDILTGELIIDKHEKLTFGKYKGRTISTIMIIDPQYMKWVMETDNKYSLSDTWRQYLEDYIFDDSRRTYSTYMR